MAPDAFQFFDGVSVRGIVVFERLDALGEKIQLLLEGRALVRRHAADDLPVLLAAQRNLARGGVEPDEAGLIQIAVSLQDHQLTLRYRDNGRGMPEEVQKKVFEPFFTTKRGSGGTGLGLHIVYNLVVFKLKGTILCHSTPGEGTEFIITAPLTPEGGI